MTDDAVLSVDVHVPVDGIVVDGVLARPPRAAGVVLFAHGSGSSRHSPRNQFVARALRQRGLATLLIDLLTPQEEAADRRTGHLRFDVPLLGARVALIAEWLHDRDDTHGLPIGVFGASTGAGAALVAAAERPALISAVVSRGGRPDLAGPALAHVTAPVLLIVGARDEPVIDLNRAAMRELRGETTIEIVPGATHLFEEPGTLEQVAELAGQWLASRLRSARPASDVV